jgi:hypothetical protein
VRLKLLVLFLLSFTIAATADTHTIQPTTTLAAETGNNSSAADSFAGQSNGNAAAGNISKLPIRSLLYAGANTKIYTHLMPWFGGKNHVDVGYDSAADAQASRQVADMASRGIDGVIIDWYGPNSTQHNTATKNILKYAEQQAKFEFVISEDYGAVKNSTNPTLQTISDLNYAWQTFMQSPTYLKVNGRPVIMFFGFEGQPVDIAAVKAALTFNPLFVFRNSGGFTKANSDGSYAWLVPLTTNYDNYMSLPYLDDFYAAALKNQTQLNFGSGYKGFNDTIAAWAPPGGRHIPQFCGQTWLNSFAEAGRYYSVDSQLPALQIVTWNDYEEGTAIEAGIDNCVSITSWMSGSRLNWSITGQENTLDHYSVFASLDGVNLEKLGEFATGTTGVDLESYSLTPANYQFFVKAVGKASMTNHMSPAVSYSVVAGSQSSAVAGADYSLSLAPLTVQIANGTSGSATIGVKSVNAAFTAPVTFSCGNLPANVSCSFSQTSVVPGANGASTVLTISTAPKITSRMRGPLGWTMLPAFGFLFAVGSNARRRAKQVAIVLSLLLLVTLGIGCGGGSVASSTQTHASAAAAPGTYSITIAASSGKLTRTTTATVTVQ